MMGPKKLSTIRQELEQSLTLGTQDPIEWLEEQLCVATGRHGVSSSKGTEVLQSLRRILEPRGKAKRRSRRISGR